MPITSYHDLIVWQKALDFVVDCYRLTERCPRSETYGLACQLQRAAVSIPSNIAEGAGRGHTREFIRFLGIARSSIFEAETQIAISSRLNYATQEEIRPLLMMVAELGRMLHGLMASLERKLEADG